MVSQGVNAIWIQVTDYDSAAKCFRMTSEVYNEGFAGMAIGYLHSAPNILMWLVFTPSGSFFYRSDQGVANSPFGSDCASRVRRTISTRPAKANPARTCWRNRVSYLAWTR
jgi:hypothetical protein